ncbi:SDR family NAD(P)-dependent oxidoreductase [Zhongshania marina]|uniref:SDR family NAD(P)-dependent oxidoreductase n=1 Tax=Zhongshania marina TaxID=2304603 RepID=UPI00268EBCBF
MDVAWSLDGKIALVTGASSGIGSHFSRVLARHGAAVVLAARRVDKLNDVVNSIIREGGKAFAVEMDVSSSESVDAAFAIIANQVGVVDILINNAGVSGDAVQLSDVSLDDWDFVMNTNLRGAWIVAKEASRRLVDAGKSGSIVNISSIYGLREGVFKLPYNISKAGVAQLTKTMAAEFSKSKRAIRVNALCPGFFDTELNSEFVNSDYGKKYISKTPAGRLGKLKELDGPLLLLVSEAGSFLNGVLLPVDGGHVIQPV